MKQQFRTRVRQIAAVMSKPPYQSATFSALDPATSFLNYANTKSPDFFELRKLTRLTFNFYVMRKQHDRKTQPTTPME